MKIEPPERGDELRYYSPAVPGIDAQGGPFLWSNCNKRSVAIDLNTDAGLEVVCSLISNADRLGFDLVVQAESGFISMNVYPDRMGIRASSAVMDIGTAMMVSNAILGALLARERQSEGQFVEVGLYDTGLLMTGWATMQHLVSGNQPERNGNNSPDTCHSGIFQASDQPFYINCGNDKIFQRLAEQVLERPDLASNLTLANRNGRIAQREFLFEELGAEFLWRPWSHWQVCMRKAQVPCGEVRTVGEAMRSAEAEARCLVTHIKHPVLGQIFNIASPIPYARTPMVDPTPTPEIGQHAQEALQDVLGWDAAKFIQVAQSGAFGVRTRQPDIEPTE